MKDLKAFQNKKGTCYVPELSDEKYTYNDFLNIAKGNKKLAEQLFSVVEWQHPETIIDEWEIEDEYKIKAVRVPDFDMIGDEHYGDSPYGVCLDVYDHDENFIESGTDWKYFETEKEAEDFCKKFNRKYKTCDNCSYDILDDEGNIMEHYC